MLAYLSSLPGDNSLAFLSLAATAAGNSSRLGQLPPFAWSDVCPREWMEKFLFQRLSCTEVGSTGPGSRQSPLCYSVLCGPWASTLNHPCLSFFICKGHNSICLTGFCEDAGSCAWP